LLKPKAHLVFSAALKPLARNAEKDGSSSTTVFTGVKPEMRIAQEEVFGPVLSIITFDDEEEAIAHRQNTQIGQGSSGAW